MTAALNFEYLGYFIVSAFAQTVVTFIGQNYGIEYAMARFLYAMPFLFLTATYEVIGSALRGMGRLTLPVVFRQFITFCSGESCLQKVRKSRF